MPQVGPIAQVLVFSAFTPSVADVPGPVQEAWYGWDLLGFFCSCVLGGSSGADIRVDTFPEEDLSTDYDLINPDSSFMSATCVTAGGRFCPLYALNTIAGVALPVQFTIPGRWRVSVNVNGTPDATTQFRVRAALRNPFHNSR